MKDSTQNQFAVLDEKNNVAYIGLDRGQANELAKQFIDSNREPMEISAGRLEWFKEVYPDYSRFSETTTVPSFERVMK